MRHAISHTLAVVLAVSCCTTPAVAQVPPSAPATAPAPAPAPTCGPVPDDAAARPFTLWPGCPAPFPVVAYSAASHEVLMADVRDAAETISTQQATIRRLVATIEHTPPPVSRAEWIALGIGIGLASGLAAWGLAEGIQ